jgi:hypothetical protein
MSTCAQACERDTQAAHDATCSHAAVVVDVSSTAHWFGTGSDTRFTAPLGSLSLQFSLPNDSPKSPKGPSQTKIVERVPGRAKTASVARAQHAPEGAAQGASIALEPSFFLGARDAHTRARRSGASGVAPAPALRTAPARMPTPPVSHLVTATSLVDLKKKKFGNSRQSGSVEDQPQCPGL